VGGVHPRHGHDRNAERDPRHADGAGLGTFNIYSDGVNPILLRFQETVPGGNNYVMLGGFSVTQAIPEPASLLTVALGVLGCGWRLRRRRR